MRVYVAASPSQVKELLTSEILFSEYLTPAQFEFDSSIDEEAREHLISLLAAEDSLELNQGEHGLVLAVDLNDDQLNGESVAIKFAQVAALLYSQDGEELSWYAPDEIEHQIGDWL